MTAVTANRRVLLDTLEPGYSLSEPRVPGTTLTFSDPDMDAVLVSGLKIQATMVIGTSDSDPDPNSQIVTSQGDVFPQSLYVSCTKSKQKGQKRRKFTYFFHGFL